MTDVETWKPLNHIPGYEASSKGNIRNSETGYILNPTYRNDGYRQVTIRVDGVRKSFYVHRLVWEAFNGDLHKHEIVVHDNCLSDDDRLENLTAMTKVWEYQSRPERAERGIDGLIAFARRHPHGI